MTVPDDVTLSSLYPCRRVGLYLMTFSLKSLDPAVFLLLCFAIHDDALVPLTVEQLNTALDLNTECLICMPE